MLRELETGFDRIVERLMRNDDDVNALARWECGCLGRWRVKLTLTEILGPVAEQHEDWRWRVHGSATGQF